MAIPQILIVEDEAKLASLLKDYLQQSAMSAHIIDDGALVLDWIKQNTPQLILLDVMLPNKDGITLLREIRNVSTVAVIMLTARVEEIDRLLGLELGADDYICKPFSPREVVARVKAVLRRYQPPAQVEESQSENRQAENQQAKNNSVEMDELTFRSKILGHAIELTAIEFRLLNVMVKQPGRIFSRDQLIDRLYDDRRIVSDRTIDSHIKKLRHKIGQRLPQEVIHSVYSVGYKFELMVDD